MKWRGEHQQKCLWGDPQLPLKIQCSGIPVGLDVEPGSPMSGEVEIFCSSMLDRREDLGGIVLVVRDGGEWGRSGSVDRTYIRGRRDKAACREIQRNELLCISSRAFL